jgi:hypothetical protein
VILRDLTFLPDFVTLKVTVNVAVTFTGPEYLAPFTGAAARAMPATARITPKATTVETTTLPRFGALVRGAIRLSGRILSPTGGAG